MHPFIQVDLTIDLVFQTKGMLHISDQTATTLLNIPRSQTHNSDLFVELGGRFDPLTDRWEHTGNIAGDGGEGESVVIRLRMVDGLLSQEGFN